MWICVLFVLGFLFVSTGGQNPEIVSDILPDVQRVGRTARLNCTVARLGEEHTVRWTFVGKPTQYVISNDQVIKVLNYRIGGIPDYRVDVYRRGNRVTFQLVIARVRTDYSGPYECAIVIANLKNTDKWRRKLGMLTVQYSPMIQPGSSEFVKMVDKGANDSLYCVARGVPTPNITWARSDGQLLPNGKALFRGRTLAIRGADVQYTGLYRCVADNQIKPPAEAFFQVYVYQEPSVRVLQDSVGQLANGRYEAKLDCIVQGYPTPSVQWGRFDGEKFTIITNNDKFKVSKQATDMQNLMNGEQWYTLRVLNVQASDFNKYYCIARNYKGRTNATVELFSTVNCQGPLCYSLSPDNKDHAEFIQFSPLMLLLAFVVQMFI